MLTKAFLDVLNSYTAGDPMDANVRWTHLHPREICQLMLEKHQVKTSNTVVKKLLNQHRFRRRMDCSPERAAGERKSVFSPTRRIDEPASTIAVEKDQRHLRL